MGRGKKYHLEQMVNLVRQIEVAIANGNHSQLAAPGVSRYEPRAQPGALMRPLTPIARLFTKTILQGAATQCYLAAHPEVASVTGQYFSDCKISEPSPAARDDGWMNACGPCSSNSSFLTEIIEPKGAGLSCGFIAKSRFQIILIGNVVRPVTVNRGSRSVWSTDPNNFILTSTRPGYGCGGWYHDSTCDYWAPPE